MIQYIPSQKLRAWLVWCYNLGLAIDEVIPKSSVPVSTIPSEWLTPAYKNKFKLQRRF